MKNKMKYTMKHLSHILLIFILLFLLFKGILYEIYAQAPSEYCYYTGPPLFEMEFTTLLLEVINPRLEEAHGFRCPIVVTCEGQEIKNPLIVAPNSFLYELGFHVKNWKNVLYPHRDITIKVYQNSVDPNNLICKDEKNLLPNTLNRLTIDLTDTNQYQGIDPNNIDLSSLYWDYNDSVANWQELREDDPEYQWDTNNFFSGDKDDEFPLDGDFDGDQISNYDEHLFRSNGVYPTIPLYLHKGINLFYFPSTWGDLKNCQAQAFNFDTDSNSWEFVTNSEMACYYYDHRSKVWEKGDPGWVESNKFNALKVIRPRILYLDLKKLNHPILYLRGFTYKQNSYVCPDTNLIDPDYFDTNMSTLQIFNTIGPEEIEMISGKRHDTHSWESSYMFFKKPSGKDIHLKPSQVYIINRKRGNAH